MNIHDVMSNSVRVNRGAGVESSEQGKMMVAGQDGQNVFYIERDVTYRTGRLCAFTARTSRCPFVARTAHSCTACVLMTVVLVAL